VGVFRSEKYLKLFIYITVIVLVNLAGITLFFRIDLTANRIYSISKVSQQVVSSLSEPLTINVFFTKDLPAPHNNTERYLHDLLEEYAIYANKYFNYRFYDVSAEEGDIRPEARANQELANNYGINPIQIQVIDEDKVKFQKAYMGLVLIHGDLIERLPTIASTERLEYQLTSAIMKLNNKISALLALKDKIRVTLYLSSSLKQVAPHIGLKDLTQLPGRIETVVKDLNRKLFDKLDYTYLDPSQDAKATDYLVTNKIDILGLKWPDLPDKNLTAGTGHIGLALEYGDKLSTVQLVNVLNLPLIGTRYEMVSEDDLENEINDIVETLIDINEDLGYLSGRGTLPLSLPPGIPPNHPQAPEALNSFRTVVSQNYSIKNVSLDAGPIPLGLNCLVIARPTEKFTDYELFQIDQFLMRGKNLAIFMDAFNEIMPQTPGAMGMMSPGPQYVPLDTGLEKLLAHYGIRINKSYVMDENCYKQEMPSQLGGGQRSIYFAPMIDNHKINNDLPFMQNIKRLVAVKISPLELIDDQIKQNGATARRLFSSSDRSWEMRDRINLNPNFIFPPQSDKGFQSYDLAYLLGGEFTSYFEGKPIPVKEQPEEKDIKSEDKTAEEKSADKTPKPDPDSIQAKVESEGRFVSRGKPGKIMLIASSEMIRDNVLDAEGRSANAVFILNSLDSLNDREDIAVMRAKKQRFNPLVKTSAGTKTFVKAFNIAGLPVLTVIFGLLVLSRRVSRKKRIQEMFGS
jgi:ABC-type uncharacterized transport system involved in gliding motility auxiliary subunit